MFIAFIHSSSTINLVSWYFSVAIREWMNEWMTKKKTHSQNKFNIDKCEIGNIVPMQILFCEIYAEISLDLT